MFHNDTNIDERKDAYAAGGVIIVTSRVLIIDLLKKHINISNIIGILIYNTHTISDTSLECFILREIYHSSYKTKETITAVMNDNTVIKMFPQFIYAFTDKPMSLLHSGTVPQPELLHVEACMQRLFITRLLLFPRFHQYIYNELNYIPTDGGGGVRITEVPISLTVNMKAVYSALLVTTNTLITEWKKALANILTANPNINTYIDKVSLDTVLYTNFDKNIQTYLHIVW